MHIGINIPPEILGRGGIEYAAVKSGLREHAKQLIFEITERGIPDELGLEALNRIPETGARVALDDVTLSGANLALLTRCHFDLIKIDQTLVAQLGGGSPAPAWLDGLSTLLRSTPLQVDRGGRRERVPGRRAASRRACSSRRATGSPRRCRPTIQALLREPRGMSRRGAGTQAAVSSFLRRYVSSEGAARRVSTLSLSHVHTTAVTRIARRCAVTAVGGVRDARESRLRPGRRTRSRSKSTASRRPTTSKTSSGVDPAWQDTLRPSKIPTTDGLYGSDGQAILSVKQSRFGVRGSNPVGNDTFKFKFEFDLFGTGVDAGQTTIRLRHVYGSLGQLARGPDEHAVHGRRHLPEHDRLLGPDGMVFVRNAQIRWTPIHSGDNTFAVAIEKPGNDIDVGQFRASRTRARELPGRTTRSPTSRRSTG